MKMRSLLYNSLELYLKKMLETVLKFSNYPLCWQNTLNADKILIFWTRNIIDTTLFVFCAEKYRDLFHIIPEFTIEYATSVQFCGLINNQINLNKVKCTSPKTLVHLWTVGLSGAADLSYFASFTRRIFLYNEIEEKNNMAERKYSRTEPIEWKGFQYIFLL